MPHHLLFYLIMVTDSMFGKIITFIFVVIFSLFLYLIKESESIHRRIINIVLLMCFTCLSIWGYAHDRQRAYYGDSIFKHNVHNMHMIDSVHIMEILFLSIMSIICT